MMVGWWIRGAVVAALVVAAAGTASGQEKKDRKGDSSGGYSAILDNMDMLVENYAKFLGRKYDLNDEQYGYTKQLLRDKVYGFLDKNETVVRDLFDQMFQARTAGNMSQDGLIDWGKRVGPIYEEAKKLIESANSEWRETLNDQQRAIHDEDLKLMKQSFDETDEKLTRIQHGEMTIEEFVKPSGGRPKGPRTRPQQTAQTAENGDAVPIGDGQRRTSQSFIKPSPGVKNQEGTNGANSPPPISPVPPDGQDPAAQHQQNQVIHPAGEAPPGEQPQPNPEAENVDPAAPTPPHARNTRTTRQVQPKGVGKNFESEWEKYVRDFIQKYQLNDEQTQRANAILADCEAQAERQLAGKKSELERIEKREGELKAVPAAGAKGAAPDAKSPDAKGGDNKGKETAELAKKRDEILAPINRIFEDQLKPKLEKLPTRAQRKAAEEAATKKAPAKAAEKAPAPGKDAKPGPAKDDKKP